MKNNAMFKTNKPSGVHVITVVKGKEKYFLPGSTELVETPFYQLRLPAGGTCLVPEEEEIVIVNPLTRKGKMVKTVKFLRDKIAKGDSSFVEITKEDLQKIKMSTASAVQLSEAHAKLLKDRVEIEAMKSKKDIFSYVEALSTLGFDVGGILAKRNSSAYLRAMLENDICIATGKESASLEEEEKGEDLENKKGGAEDELA